MRALAVLALLALALTSVTALTAANTVAPSGLGQSVRPIGPNGLKPSACAGITLTATIIGSGTVTGTGASELLLGGAGAETLDGGGGDDCILGGGGNDTISGGSGTDVCIGGPGTDAFGLVELLSGCETIIQ